MKEGDFLGTGNWTGKDVHEENVKVLIGRCLEKMDISNA